MRFQCPNCKEILSVDNAEMGAKVQCGKCQQIVTVPASRTAPGAVIADFIIEKELGRGGMGVVYLSHQISLDRSAALKVLAENYAQNSEFVISFIKEARAAARLNHPHIVQAYAVGEDDGIYYFAMENVDGQTMKEILEKNHVIPVDQAVQIVQQIAEALDYAWKEQRLIHRDIKPDNIMLTSTGKAKLADLGLARHAGEKDSLDSEEEVMGTPQYISPEHLTGAPMDIRSDIYSLGATFYHFVTGQFPFNGSSVTEIAKKHLTDTLVPPNQVKKSIPQAVSDVIVKMMARDPNDRFQDAEELVETLRDIRKNKLSAPKLSVPSSVSAPIPRLNLQNSTSAPVPKLSIPGNAPKLNIPASGTSVSGGVPKLKLSTPAPAAAPAPQKTEEPKAEELPKTEETPSAPKKTIPRKVIVLIIAVLVVLGLAGAGTWFVLSGNFEKVKDSVMKKAEEVAGPKADPQPAPDSAPAEQKAEPQKSALIEEADKILKQAADNPSALEETASLCNGFLARFKEPKEEEREKYAAVETLAGQVREKLTAAKEAAAKAAEEKRKADEERRRREAEARRQREEADRKRRAEEDAVRKYKGFANWVRGEKVKKIVPLVHSGDIAAAKREAQGLIDEPQRNQNKPAQVVREAKNLAGYGWWLKSKIESAERIEKLLTNSSESELNRPQVTFKGNLGSVISIKNGIMTVESFGKSAEVPVKELKPRQKADLVARIARKNSKYFKDAVVWLIFNEAYRTAAELWWDRKDGDCRNFANAVLDMKIRAAGNNKAEKERLQKDKNLFK